MDTFITIFLIGVVVLLVLVIVTRDILGYTKRRASNYERALGTVLHIRYTQNGRNVIVEYEVDGNKYRCVNNNYLFIVEVGSNVEVFYDKRDPRESKLGSVLDGSLNTLVCDRCAGPFDAAEPVCPLCGHLITPDLYKEGVHQKPLNTDVKSNVLMRKGLNFLGGFALLYFVLYLIVGFVGNHYEAITFCLTCIVILVGLLLAKYVYRTVVFDGTAEGQVVFVHERTLHNDQIRNWTIVAEFEANGKKYRSVRDLTYISFFEGQGVRVIYNTKDPRRSEFK